MRSLSKIFISLGLLITLIGLIGEWVTENNLNKLINQRTIEIRDLHVSLDSLNNFIDVQMDSCEYVLNTGDTILCDNLKKRIDSSFSVGDSLVNEVNLFISGNGDLDLVYQSELQNYRTYNRLSKFGMSFILVFLSSIGIYFLIKKVFL